MASLFDWLAKRAEGVVAQINPWDNGADYNSVVHGARPQLTTTKVQSASSSPQRQQPQSQTMLGTFNPAQSSQSSVQQHNLQAPQRLQIAAAPKPSFSQAEQKALEAAPKMLSFQGQRQWLDQHQDLVNKLASIKPDYGRAVNQIVNGVGQFMLDNTSKLANQGLGIAENNIIGHGVADIQRLTGHPEAAQQTQQYWQDRANSLLKQGGGLFGAGGIYNSTEALHQADPLDALKRVGGTGLGSAAETLPIGAGTKLFKGASPAFNKIMGGIGLGLGTGAAYSTGSQLSNTGSVDPLQLVGDTAAGGLFGGGIPIAGYGLKGGVKAIGKLAGGRGRPAQPDIPVASPQAVPQTHPSVQYREGLPILNSPVSRSDMQRVQMEHNRLRGTNAPNVNFVDEIRTPDGQRALGSTEGSQVNIARYQKDPMATLHHETVHAVLNDHMTPEVRASLIDSYRSTRRTTSDNPVGIEDQMAEDFTHYVAARNGKTKADRSLPKQIADQFEQIWQRIKDTYVSLAKTGRLTPEFKKFYKDLYDGKYADNTPARITHQIDPETLATNESRTMRNKMWENASPEGRRQIEAAEREMQRRGLSSRPAYRIDPKTKPSKKVNRLDAALAHDKQFPNSIDFAALKAEYKGDKNALAKINQHIADKKATRAANKLKQQTDEAYDRELNAITQQMNPMDIASIREARAKVDNLNERFGKGRVYGEQAKSTPKPTTAPNIPRGTQVVNAFDRSTSQNQMERPSAETPAPHQSQSELSQFQSKVYHRPNQHVEVARHDSPSTTAQEHQTPPDQTPEAISPTLLHEKPPESYHSSSESLTHAGDDRNIVELTPKQQRDVRREIDNVIYDENPDLLAREMYGDQSEYWKPLSEDGAEYDGIPRLHVDDLRHYLGKQAEGIPSAYKRRSGPRNVDLMAQNAYGGEVDDYLDAWLHAIESKANDNEMTQKLRELRKNPEVRQKAEDRVRKRIAEAQDEIDTSRQQRRDALLAGKMDDVKALDEYIADLEKNTNMRRTKPPKITNIDVKGTPGKNLQEYVAVTSDGPSGGSVTELVPLDTKEHTIRDGTVVDKKGRSVGSYVAIDEDGNQYAYVAGKPVNISKILGDIDAWGNVNHAYMDMDRIIEANAPDKGTARRVQQFITQFKDQQEAMMKTDLLQKRVKLQKLEKRLNDVRPKNVSKKDFSADLFRMMEKKVDMNEMRAKYGDKLIDNNIIPTLKWTRKFLDEILDKTNRVLERNGYDQIPRRDNYMTHIQDDPTFWEKVGIGISDLNPFGSSISSEINPGKVRGGVPDEIVGRTADTGARRRWNPFAQERRGSAHKQDYFDALDKYLEPMLFNEYMTPAASRARVVEKAFRTYEKAKELKFNELADIVGIDEARKLQPTKKTHKNYESGRTSPLIAAWQEYGNMLAGKTNAIDRVVLDKAGDAGGKVLKVSTKAQGITGANLIPGSTTAALAQVLSIPQTIARDSSKSVLLGARDMLSKTVGTSNDPMMKSSFMRARYTDATSRRRSAMRRYTHAASRPMEMIERTTGELSWRSAYREALSKGLSGDAAIKAADVETKKTLAGRGVGDRPVIMNSKALGVVTQFGLEVGNMGVQFSRDFTLKQKIKFIVAASALDAIYGIVTGQVPLPDYIGAAIDTYNDFTNSDDDKKDGALTNIGQAAQRFAGETAKFIPGAPSIAGLAMSDDTKQAFFGKDSDVSRYGAPAVSRVFDAGKDAIQGAFGGDWKKVRDAGLSVVPTGNQIKRSLQGGEAVNQGYVETGSGRVRSPVDRNNPVNWLQGLTFGQYALPGSQKSLQNDEYLGSQQSSIFKTLNEKDPQAAQKYYDTIMQQRSTGVSTSSNDTMTLEATKKAKIDSGTWKVRDGMVVDKNGNVQRQYYKDLAASYTNQNSPEAIDAYSKGYDISPKLSDQSRKTLVDYYTMDSDGRDQWFNDQKNAEYLYYSAKYENDVAQGSLTTAQKIRAQKALAKDKVGSVYPKNVRDLYSLSKADLYKYLSKNDGKTDKAKIAKQLIAYDQALYNAGLTSYLKFKAGIAPSRGRGRSGGGRSSTSKLLYDLKLKSTIGKATSGAKLQKPTTTKTSELYKKAILKHYTPRTISTAVKPHLAKKVARSA